MIVCAHGNVSEFCEKRDMVIAETYAGDIEDYCGVSRILVSDMDMSEYEYYYLKQQLLSCGVEFISTKHKDSGCLSDFIRYSVSRDAKKQGKKGGRTPFGCGREDGKLVLRDSGRAVIRRILELRDKGYTYRKIREDEGVHHPNGEKICISTIQIIVKNREKYEREEF